MTFKYLFMLLFSMTVCNRNVTLSLDDKTIEKLDDYKILTKRNKSAIIRDLIQNIPKNQLLKIIDNKNQNEKRKD